MANGTITTRPDTSSSGITVDDLRTAVESAGFTIEGLREDMTERDVLVVASGLLDQIAELKV